jgi:peptidoglycan-associated lipoprotein
MSLPRAGTLLLLAPLLLAGKCKKPPDEEKKDAVDLPPPSMKLQVAGIDPAFAPAGRSLEADVYGGGFERGARVLLSGTDAERVDVTDDATIHIQVPPLPSGFYDVTVLNQDGGRATLRKGLTLTEPRGEACRRLTVRFDFDSSLLAGDVRSELDTAAACLRNSTAAVRIEGHCDERGTTEYNVALGQRRAEAVQRYLVGQGVSPARMTAVSWGEERPVDRSGSPQALAQNRRVELIPSE